MEKTEAVNKLKKAGYQVQFDSSIVTVLLEKNTSLTQEIKKLKAYFKEIGYDASFCIKQQKKGSIPEKIEEEAEADVEIGEQFSLEDFGIS